MQRGRTTFDSFLSETIDLNEGSFSNNTSMDHSGSWDNMVNPVDNRLSNYMHVPDDDNGNCTNGAHNVAQRFWDRGESSSSANNLQERDSKLNLGWSSSFDAYSGSDSRSADCSFEPFDNSGPSYVGNHMAGRSLGMQNYNSNQSSLNMIPNYGHARENDRHIGVGSQPYTLFKSGHSEAELFPNFYTSSSSRGNSSGSSSTFLDNSDSPSPTFGTWGSSCKRKSLEGTSGQFYVGSSSSNQPADHMMQHSVPGCYSAPRNLNVSSGPLNLSPTNHSEQLNSRNGVGMSRVPPCFFPSSSVPGIVEGSARNFATRSNLGQHDSVPFGTPRGTSARHSGVYASRPISNIGSSEFRPTMTPPMNSNNITNQPQIRHVNEARRMLSYPWNGSFSSSGESSSSSFMAFGERDSGVFEEVNVRRSPRNNLEYPMTVSAPETRNVRHDQIDWSFTPGTSSSSRNLSSSSQINPPSGGRASSATLLPHQYQTSQNHQMLSESLSWIPYQHIESNSGTQRSNFALFPQGSSSSDAAANTSRTRHHSDYRSSSSSMDMPGDDINSWHALAAVEGRHRLIRQVFSAMRRGANLRAEDYVLIDPFINGFAELHDRHRDMRLDVDNMSYEELLALEERIGNVSTGLTEEKIRGSLKQRRYNGNGASRNLEPCCICQEDYVSGDDMGILDCGHEFHTGCIKQWLIVKNLCPVCKMTALGT